MKLPAWLIITSTFFIGFASPMTAALMAATVITTKVVIIGTLGGFASGFGHVLALQSRGPSSNVPTEATSGGTSNTTPATPLPPGAETPKAGAAISNAQTQPLKPS